MILIISALFPPEPVVSANLSFDIASELSSGNDVVVISPKPTRPYGMDFSQSNDLSISFEHVILSSYTCPKSKIIGRMRESFSFGAHIKKYIEENHEKIDVIYANVWPLFAQKKLSDVASLYNIPYILHVHDIYPESLCKKLGFAGFLIQKLLLPLDRENLLKAEKIITISSQMKTYLSKTRSIKEERIATIRNWQNDSAFGDIKIKRSAKRNENSKFCFLYLGSINPTAGVELLIGAFGKANLDNACLVIAGDGPNKPTCIKLAQRYKNIKFMEVKPDDVPEVQAKADILLLPLKKGVAETALPSKMTAYMFSSKPIIACVDGDSEVAEIVNQNKCGWVVEPGNEQELIKCMVEVIGTDRNQLKIIGCNSLDFARKKLTKALNLKKLVNIILEIKKGFSIC